MNINAGAGVVVGVDGSDCSLAAVRVAAAEAAARQRPLLLVHAFIWPQLHVATGPAVDGPPDTGLRHHAEALLAEAGARARKVAPDLGEAGPYARVGLDDPVRFVAVTSHDRRAGRCPHLLHRHLHRVRFSDRPQPLPATVYRGSARRP